MNHAPDRQAFRELNVKRVSLALGGDRANKGKPAPAVVGRRGNDQRRTPSGLFVSRLRAELQPNKVARRLPGPVPPSGASGRFGRAVLGGNAHYKLFKRAGAAYRPQNKAAVFGHVQFEAIPFLDAGTLQNALGNADGKAVAPP